MSRSTGTHLTQRGGGGCNFPGRRCWRQGEGSSTMGHTSQGTVPIAPHLPSSLPHPQPLANTLGLEASGRCQIPGNPTLILHGAERMGMGGVGIWHKRHNSPVWRPKLQFIFRAGFPGLWCVQLPEQGLNRVSGLVSHPTQALD